MAIEILSAREAWEALAENDQSRWPSRQKAGRLSPLASPRSRPSFTIDIDEKVFCIGSCFAREIEQAMDGRGYEVLSIVRDLPKSPMRTVSDAGMFNKYNVATICNELSWALDHGQPYSHEAVFIEDGEGLVADYQLSGNLYLDEPGPAREFREKFNDAFKQVVDTDVVVLTLGLSELWYDKLNRLYLNKAVSRSLATLYPGRFELHVFDYQETAHYLEKIYGLLSAHLKKTFRLLITVSPVPLLATFRQQDILVANCYSKSVLRAAVESFACNRQNVNYFPSYETVTLSNPGLVWKDRDLRHVDNSFVHYIIDNVSREFLPSAAVSGSELCQAIVLFKGGFFRQALAIVKELRQRGDRFDKRLFLLWLGLLLRLKGRYRTMIIAAVEELQQNEKRSLWSLLRERRNMASRIKDSGYVGCLDHWDGRELSGWACCFDREEPVKLLVKFEDGESCRVTADQPRPDIARIYGDNYLHSGFRLGVEEKQRCCRIIRVVFSATGRDLNNSPMANSNPANSGPGAQAR